MENKMSVAFGYRYTHKKEPRQNTSQFSL